MRTIAGVSGALGGGCWILRFLLDVGGTAPDAGSSRGLHWVGLALLAVAACLGGLALVRRSPLWLKTIVGVGAPLLMWSVLEMLHGSLPELAVDATFGALALGFSVYRQLQPNPQTRRSSGTRSSR